MPLPFNTTLLVGRIYILISHLEEQRSRPVFRWEIYLPLALNEGHIYQLRDSTGDFGSFLCKDLTAQSSVFKALEIGRLNMESQKGIRDCLVQVREHYNRNMSQSQGMNEQDWIERAMYELHLEGMVELPRGELGKSREELITRRIKEIEIDANQVAIWEQKRRSFPLSVIEGQGLVFENGWWTRPVEGTKEESDTLDF